MATAAALFKPLNTKRAFDEISDQIRELIYSGVFKPGDKLPAERELGSQFKAGRMVVREALRTLEAAGLVFIKQGRCGGAFVKTAGTKAITRSISDMIRIGNVSLRDLTEARHEIEKIVLGLSVKNIDRQDLDSLEKNINESEENISKRIRPLEAHANFHILLAKSTHNVLFERIVESIMEVSTSFVTPVHDNKIFQKRTLNYHKEIIQAVKRKDLRKARAIMERHLTDADRRLLGVYEGEN